MTKTRIQAADWSTINLEQLRKLPTYDWSGKGYTLQTDSGNGCAGDPPGFPTYFTQSVYTRHGNNPDRGYSMVIVHNGTAYGVEPASWSGTWEEHQAKRDALMRRLWQPLPLGHPRTQAWIRATFSHHRHCYHAPGFKDWSKDMLIWPGGCLGQTPFGKIENEVATPENHDGTILVRRYYPEFQPTPELIEAGFNHPGNWWETLRDQPTPANCPGQYSHAHPVNGSWCQMCGWHQ